MLARRTRSRLLAKRNDSRMIGVGHDGMTLLSDCSVFEFMISCMGLGWWALYIYHM
jgi:hypothetical protein